MACAVALASGCGADDADDGPTGSALFDPCTDIKNGTFRKAGFDPATKTHPAPDTFPQRCAVDRTGGGGLVLEHVMNIGPNSAYERALGYARSDVNGHPTTTTINGREAFTTPQSLAVLDKTIPMGCDAYLRTKLGTLRIGMATDAATCKGVLEAATVLEPSLGRDR
ncbi:hypothetical protein GFY24_17675 [Nocardia sp. SYP-A9097]|nr:hypothetical protein [Nocardia sp. SYP-A9097]